ncbi:bola protein [Gaertneriomyces semiglobifer]|nr:bola protein [Gaertneriomyces semiglobifer]
MSLFRPLQSLVSARIVRPSFSSIRSYSSQPAHSPESTLAPLQPDYTEGERTIHEKLANQLQATKLRVADISGGCGSMYAVQIASPLFRGQSLVKQHRMVTELLKDDIKGMHGIQIKTEAA